MVCVCVCDEVPRGPEQKPVGTPGPGPLSWTQLLPLFVALQPTSHWTSSLIQKRTLQRNTLNNGGKPGNNVLDKPKTLFTLFSFKLLNVIFNVLPSLLQSWNMFP